jgi:rubrerythrin
MKGSFVPIRPLPKDTEHERMAEFANAFYGNASLRKLTHSELVRAIRLMVTDEYEAISVYTQLAESTDNELAKEVLIDIANEEKVHAGEFLRLLKELAPDEEQWYADGAAEVEAEIAKMAGAPAGSEAAAGGEVKPVTIGSLKE